MRAYTVLLICLAGCKAAGAAEQQERVEILYWYCNDSPCHIGVEGDRLTISAGTLPDDLIPKGPPPRNCQYLPPDWSQLDLKAVITEDIGTEDPMTRAVRALGCDVVYGGKAIPLSPYCTVQYVTIPEPRAIPHVHLTQTVGDRTASWGYADGRLIESDN